MSISETAFKNQEEWFPNRKSKLAETEPELIEVFDNSVNNSLAQKVWSGSKHNFRSELCKMVTWNKK